MASKFNQYFQSMFTIEISELNRIPSDKVANGNIKDLTLEQAVLSLLLSFNARKSTGPYAIPNEILRTYDKWVTKYLTRIF